MTLTKQQKQKLIDAVNSKIDDLKSQGYTDKQVWEELKGEWLTDEE